MLSDVKFTQIKKGQENYNWLFIPGGPAADSSYMNSLIDILHLPGNIWLIDLPGNGSNIAPDKYDFREWLDLIPAIAEKYENTIIVAHSFGGVLSLLSNGLEDFLKGIIILNSAPSLWFEESALMKSKLKIPNLPELDAFNANPSQENFKKALLAHLPYMLSDDTLERGMDIFSNLDYPYETPFKMLQIIQDINYDATWVPQNIITYIVGGSKDALVPFSIFESDERFDRENIEMFEIEGASHWSWLDKPLEVKNIFDQFVFEIINS